MTCPAILNKINGFFLITRLEELAFFFSKESLSSKMGSLKLLTRKGYNGLVPSGQKPKVKERKEDDFQYPGGFMEEM